MASQGSKNYWYMVQYNNNGMISLRQGNVRANYAYHALTQAQEIAKKEWGVIPLNVTIKAITEDGEMGEELVTTNTGRQLLGLQEQVKPWCFGTVFSKKTFPTLKLETNDVEDSL